MFEPIAGERPFHNFVPGEGPTDRLRDRHQLAAWVREGRRALVQTVETGLHTGPVCGLIEVSSRATIRIPVELAQLPGEHRLGLLFQGMPELRRRCKLGPVVTPTRPGPKDALNDMARRLDRRFFY